MKNRILSFKWVAPSTLEDHPQNWRVHNENQKAAMQAVLDSIGVADAILVYKSQASGKMTIVDGHMRRSMLDSQDKVPVLVLDLNDEEAKAMLATHDPLAFMAGRDDEEYNKLLAEIGAQDPFKDLARMFNTDGVPGQDGDPEADAAYLGDEVKGKYDIVPQYDEGYDAVIITSVTEQEWAQLMTVLPLPKKIERHGKIGGSHVITAKEFMKLWQASKS